LDCSASLDGQLCISNACGCNGTADCLAAAGGLAGRSCDTTDHVCEDYCDAGQPCNGGCCSDNTGGLCNGGAANGSCGDSGECIVCGGDTPTCDTGACINQCGGAGDGTCDGGTCCSAGLCITGDQTTACGSSGDCVDCTGCKKNTGGVCVTMAADTYQCGCRDDDLYGDADCIGCNGGRTTCDRDDQSPTYMTCN
jgi:hypothetical protein